MRRRHSPEQDREIRRRYEAGETCTQLATAFGGARGTILAAIRRAGGTVRKFTWNKNHPACQPLFTGAAALAIKAEYESGLDTYEIAEIRGVSQACIWRTLQRLGTEMRSAAPERLPIDETVFDHAEHSQAAAYFVGLMMSDGSICRGGKRGGSVTVKLLLADPDGDHVREFRDFLKSGHALTRTTITDSRRGWNSAPATQIQVGSDRLADALARYGVVPRKSLTAEVKILEGNRDFWRGMVCGDGCLRIDDDGMPWVQLAGSLPNMQLFRAYCLSIMPVPFRANISRNKTIWQIDFKGAKAYRVVKNLFDGCTVALPRKWEKAKTILEQCRRLESFELHRDWSALTAKELLALRGQHRSWHAVARALGMSIGSIAAVRRKLVI